MLASVLSLASMLLPLSALASPLAFDRRAGAPITQQKVTVSNLTQCGIANVSWSGPGQEPYTLMIGQGGFYVGISEVISESNITNTSSAFWIVDQEFATSLIFEVINADDQYTYTQNQIVGAPATNGTLSSTNGTVVCDLGSGFVNASTFAAYQAGTLFPGGNGTTVNGTKVYGNGTA